ncbi:hypothetical protein VNO77_42247 [Canavalia gladiata]|uniref:Uncharacterized protein n=1 Tax=Canavalia gladiata TaxID=3824 RepID=A0AAN9PT81_CANGL
MLKDTAKWTKETATSFTIVGTLTMNVVLIQRPWEEDTFTMSEEVVKMIALEELQDGSLRIEQHFITNKLSQHKIFVWKNGSKIGIGLLFYSSFLFEYLTPACTSYMRECALDSFSSLHPSTEQLIGLMVLEVANFCVYSRFLNLGE